MENGSAKNKITLIIFGVIFFIGIILPTQFYHADNRSRQREIEKIKKLALDACNETKDKNLCQTFNFFENYAILCKPGLKKNVIVKPAMSDKHSFTVLAILPADRYKKGSWKDKYFNQSSTAKAYPNERLLVIRTDLPIDLNILFEEIRKLQKK